MGESMKEVVGTALQKIFDACNTRKLLQLRQDCKSALDGLDGILFRAQSGPAAVVVAAEEALRVSSSGPSEQAADDESRETSELVGKPVDSGEGPNDGSKETEESTQQVGGDDQESTDSDPSTVIDLDVSDEVENGDDEPGGQGFDGEGIPAEHATSASHGGEESGVRLLPVAFGEAAAAEIFPIFNAAIMTKRAALAEIVLDCLQSLVAHRHVQGVVTLVGTSLKSGASQDSMEVDEDGESGMTENPTKIPYQGAIIDMICRCDDIQDEGVELKVLKALLTCVTSTIFCVHGQGLLLAMRTCYNIYMISRSQVNQTTAKASLTQMLNVVFQRMEANQQDVPVSPIVVSDLLGLPAAPPHDTTSVSGFVQTFVNRVVSDTIFASSHEDVRQTVAGAFDKRAAEGEASESDSDNDHIVWREGNAKPSSHSRVPTAEQLPVSPVIEANAGPLIDTFHRETLDPRGGILQKDAFLVFRALCKLSISTSPDLVVLDSAAVRGKVLALELVKVLLENSGPVFKASEKFMGAIRQYLCLSLLKNCASPISQALSLSSSIFMTLLTKFRKALKAEIAVFFPMILLKPIEPQIGNTNSQQPATAVATSYAHQLVVLRCIKAKCTDGQLLVDLFVNYDCDIENSNLFERLIMALVRKAQGSGNAVDLPDKSQQQEAILRQEALHSLVNILWALVKWHQTSRTVEAEQVCEESDDVSDRESYGEDSHMDSTQTRLPRALDGPAGDPSRMLTPSPRRGTVDGEDGQQSSTGPLAGDTARGAELLQKRKYKSTLYEGINLFNKHPMKGVEFWIKKGILQDEPESIAAFFEKTEGLDKTMIGEYLGSPKEKCLEVMHAYVDSMDFTDMELDVALRAFLSGFRLPGEAQKIDRLMEKFAERFVKCNPGAFKSADVAYVLSYSMIMLNTDAHNDQVKVKMTKEGFIKNNKGINDGADLPEDYLSAIFDRIVDNEIKMRDDSLLDGGTHGSLAAQNNKAGAWRDLFLSLIPGRRQAKLNEPSEDAIKRTQEYLREKAKGATFFEATEWDTVRPMLEVSWPPMLGAFSQLFEQFDDQHVVALCLDGFQASVNVTAQLGMSMMRTTFMSSLCRFTLLHAPNNMKVKNALAFKTIVELCDQVGNHLQENWKDALWCVSRWELLYQSKSGGPTDASLFSDAKEGNASETGNKSFGFKQRFRQLSMRGSEIPGTPTSAQSPGQDNKEDLGEIAPSKKITNYKDGEWVSLPEAVLLAVDIQDINRLFVNSQLLDSEAIVDFVQALCAVSSEELQSTQAPRVFSLTKIVEIAHFNMGRIRLVWSRIWSILSDFFVQVGCQNNLQLAMNAVDSLRQLSMKFLERDELANYTFQNDFLNPFVIVMRKSMAVEIRELIIRCVSQMVLARVANVKSGWKSMFMVFTTAAGDKESRIVHLAFETIQKIVREHFNYITETDPATFTDCVNCLIAFTNTGHEDDVPLNSIAFLRYCAIKLAEGSIGELEELPEDATPISTTLTRIVPAASTPSEIPPLESQGSRRWKKSKSLNDSDYSQSSGLKGSQSNDKLGDKYFWLPLIFGLSELTFDPREKIRSSSLEVLFDILRFHGHAYSAELWEKIIVAGLLPVFDHVRAEVTDTTTFTPEKRREEEDAWLYETCLKCLQHLVDLYLQFYSVLSPFVDRLFMLLSNFMKRPHQSLASMAVAALLRFLSNAGEKMGVETWRMALDTLENVACDTRPGVKDLITPPERFRRRKHNPESTVGSPTETGTSSWTLRSGIGSRRLLETQSRNAVQLLLVQAAGDIYANYPTMESSLLLQLLGVLETITNHARLVNSDQNLRQGLAVLQAEDRLAEEARITDPPLLRLESEAAHAYLSVLLDLSLNGLEETNQACDIEKKMVELCLANLKRFEGDDIQPGVQNSPTAHSRVVAKTSEGAPVVMASTTAESSMYSPLVVATLRALNAFPEEIFKKHLQEFFPHMTNLIAFQHSSLEVQQALSAVFDQRIGPLIL